MGQKVNPIAFRLAVNKDWRSKWYASGKDYTKKPHEDLAIRAYFKNKLVNAGLARIGAASTAIISNVSPLLTIYFAVVLLGEEFTLPHAIGTALVVGGVGYHTWREIRKPVAEAT